MVISGIRMDWKPLFEQVFIVGQLIELSYFFKGNRIAFVLGGVGDMKGKENCPGFYKFYNISLTNNYIQLRK